MSTEEMAKRISSVIEVYPWLVYEEAGTILGYAYTTRWATRAAYRKSAETSVYLGEDARGKGIGTALYQTLLERLKTTDLHMVYGGIALPNDASIGLHEKLGYKKVAHFPEIGFKFGRWIDVGYWARPLD